MRSGNVRVRALVDFTDRRIGSAKAGERFVCSDSDARRLIGEGKAEIPDSKIVPRPEPTPGKGPVGAAGRPQEPRSLVTGDTPEPTGTPGEARRWPFSAGVRASTGKPSKPRGGGAGGS